MPSKLPPKDLRDKNCSVMAEWRSRIDRGLKEFDRIIYDSNPEGYARAYYYFRTPGGKPELGCVIEGPHEPLQEAAALLGDNSRIVLQPQKRKATAAAAAAAAAVAAAAEQKRDFGDIPEENEEEEMDETDQLGEERAIKKARQPRARLPAGPSKPTAAARRKAQAGPSRLAPVVHKQEEQSPPRQLAPAPSTDLNSLRQPSAAFDDMASVASYRTNVTQMTQAAAGPSYDGLGSAMRIHSAMHGVARLDVDSDMREDKVEVQQAIQVDQQQAIQEQAIQVEEQQAIQHLLDVPMDM